MREQQRHICEDRLPLATRLQPYFRIFKRQRKSTLTYIVLVGVLDNLDSFKDGERNKECWPRRGLAALLRVTRKCYWIGAGRGARLRRAKFECGAAAPGQGAISINPQLLRAAAATASGVRAVRAPLVQRDGPTGLVHWLQTGAWRQTQSREHG